MPRQLFRNPKTRLGRFLLGWALIAGGLLGFLPILGFWMLPLGLLVLSADYPVARRWRRRLQVGIGKWQQRNGRRNGRARPAAPRVPEPPPSQDAG